VLPEFTARKHGSELVRTSVMRMTDAGSNSMEA